MRSKRTPRSKSPRRWLVALDLWRTTARGSYDHARTGQPRAPAEVDVLEIGEIVVVESAEGEERLAARNHVAAAGEENLRAGGRLLARRQRIAESVLKGVAVEGERAADEVDQLAGRIDDLAADRDRRRPARCSIASTSAASQPSSGTASLLRKITLRAGERASAAAMPPVKPWFAPSGSSRTFG